MKSILDLQEKDDCLEISLAPFLYTGFDDFYVLILLFVNVDLYDLLSLSFMSFL